MLGPDQPVAPAAEALNGRWRVVATTDAVEACTPVNIVVMVGRFPKKEGMERRNVFEPRALNELIPNWKQEEDRSGFSLSVGDCVFPSGNLVSSRGGLARDIPSAFAIVCEPYQKDSDVVDLMGDSLMFLILWVTLRKLKCVWLFCVLAGRSRKLVYQADPDDDDFVNESSKLKNFEVKVKENKGKGKEKKVKKVNVIIGSVFPASMSRMWRALYELLFGTPSALQYLSGVILFEETLYQKTAVFFETLNEAFLDWQEVGF
ncbi:malate dehydrogenase [Tanacetum coccineum]|uniref:fructose-bisphosphate aldolase n=1 Tax=Tanacetum coccineum TaxID=301880 RepID=A0ABQ5CZS1_9ASTR